MADEFDPAAEPPTNPPARRPLLWIGAGLWGAVFVALIAAFLLQSDETPSGESQSSLITVEGEQLVAAKKGEAGGRLLPEGAKPNTNLDWDPDGLPAFSLTERRGETVTKKTLSGAPFIAGFVFVRCPTICPKVTAAMERLRKPLAGTGVKLVTLTVDPEHDTPEILTNYADFYGAVEDENWLFLTGDEDEIYELIGEGFKQPVSRDDDATDPGWAVFHTANLMLVGPDGVVRRKYNSQVPGEMAELRHDAKKLAAETSVAGQDEAPEAEPTDENSDA
ncbi:MAG: SCO family protein [Planctomycetota bacterium]